MRHFTDDERRARLAIRHGLAPGHRYADPCAATRAMTVLHATEAATVHLALWARMTSVNVEDVEKALYVDRSIVKQLAMRRTLFVFPRELLPAAWGSAARRTADQQYRDLVKRVTEAGISADADAWIDATSAAVLDLLSDGVPRTAAQIRESVPQLGERFTNGGPGAKWGGSVPIGPSLITLMAVRGDLMRATNAAHWRLNKPTWTTTKAWLGDMPEPTSQDDGYVELITRWLWTFGPGTETDIVWWLGSTKTAVRTALAEIDAEPVTVDGGGQAWVLPGDTDPVPSPEPWAALLPTLDPTVMGWKERRFYLADADRPYLFDTNGNAGNTAWWNGRIVGAWAQDDDGVVHVLPRADIGAEAAAALDAEAARLTTWLDGVRISSVYKSHQMRQLPLP